jgi:sialate O-acetylesterase
LAQPFGQPKAFVTDSTEPFISNIKKTWNSPVTDDWRAHDRLEEIVETTENYSNRSFWLYNGMVAPVVKFKIKGFIWSQGEADAAHPGLYAESFSKMIRNWRNAWDMGDLPFLFVQSTSYMPQPDQETYTRVKLREAQAEALKLPNTGMVVSVDLGDPYDVHAKNKKEIGRRLALQALRKVYNRQVIADGPVYKSYVAEKECIRILFETLGAGIQWKEVPGKMAFRVIGHDEEFCVFDVKVVHDEIIICVKSKTQVAEIHYAGNDYPVCSVYNSEGLPAASFYICLD